MLVLNNDEITVPQIKHLINEFRRVQVSRFPIEVVVQNGGNLVGFVDSRFPTDRFNVANMLAMLYVKDEHDGKTTLTIESRLINNEKYAMHNEMYKTKSTHDVKKMFRYMKDYIKPYSGQEVAHKTYRSVESDFEGWQRKAEWELKEVLHRVDYDDWMFGIKRLQELGVLPTDKFAEIAKTGIPLFDEHKRRQALEKPNHHILINPDDSVVVTIMKGDNKGSQTLESLDACPLFIQQAVGMLKMVDERERVPEIGVRIGSHQFWVEGKPQ